MQADDPTDEPSLHRRNLMNSTRNLRPLVLALGLALASLGATASAAESSTAQDLSDARREAQIWTTYGFNPHLRALDISVDVNGANAVLTGTVSDGVEKELAEQIALGIEGIDKVDNRLLVDGNYTPKTRTASADGKRDFTTTVEDATITASVKSKLLWSANTNGLEIDVDTLNGKVTLNGTAPSAASKDLAARMARNTDGVRAVDNRLTVDASKPATGADAAVVDAEEAVTDSWITTKVKSTFAYSRWVDANDIEVTTNDGVVVLKGEVESGTEKDLAAELAQNVRGVRKVDASGLTVAG
jgi:osmotically-inducible protein OsmY